MIYISNITETLKFEKKILLLKRKLQNSNITSKDESLCNAIDNALNILKEVDLVLRYGQRDHRILLEKVWL